MPAGTQRIERCRYLGHGSLGHRAVVGAICDQHHRDTLATVTRRPVERNSLGWAFFQRHPISLDRLLKPLCSILPLADQNKHSSEVVLRLRPVERNPFAYPLLERRAVGDNGILQPLRPAFLVAKRNKSVTKTHQHITEIGLDGRPIERCSLPGEFKSSRTKRDDCVLKKRCPLATLAKPQKRSAEIHLRACPVKRNPRTRALQQRIAISANRF